MRFIRNLLIAAVVIVIGTPAGIGFALWSPNVSAIEVDVTGFDSQSAVEGKIQSALFNAALGNEVLVFEEEFFNKIITKELNNSLPQDERTVKIAELDDLEVGLEAIWIDIEKDHFYFNILGKVGGYQSLLSFDFIVVEEDEDIVFEFNGFKIGRIKVSQGILEKVIDKAVTKANEEGEDIDFSDIEDDVTVGTLDISDLMYRITKTEINNELRNSMDLSESEMPIVINGLKLADDSIMINFYVDADTAYGENINVAIDALTGLLQDDTFKDDVLAIEGVEGTEFATQFEEITEKLQDSMNNDGTIPTYSDEEISGFVEAIEELDQETQKEIFHSVYDNLDPEVKDQILEMLGQQENTEE